MKHLPKRIISFWHGLKIWERVVLVICLVVIVTQTVQLFKPADPPYVLDGFTWTRLDRPNDPVWLEGRDFKITVLRYAILLESTGISETYELPMMQGYYLYKQSTPFTVTLWSGVSTTPQRFNALQVTNNPSGCSDSEVKDTGFSCSPSYLKITLTDHSPVYVENNRGSSYAVIDDTINP